MIFAEKLTPKGFAPFGDIVDKKQGGKFPINNGKCIRHHDLATVEIGGKDARAIISIFAGTAYELPHMLDMVERHPLGSQAFMPLHERPFLVIACPDDKGRPGEPQAFVTEPGQGINFHRNVWHGVLTPLREDGDFLVVDRDGEGENLEEYRFDEPYIISVKEQDM